MGHVRPITPAMAAEFDWSKGYEPLESEFRQVARDAAMGRRTMDLLVRVFLVGGKESWILVHVEVQNQTEWRFPEVQAATIGSMEEFLEVLAATQQGEPSLASAFIGSTPFGSESRARAPGFREALA